ncbi:CBM96 family carbohydrate-binding protein [Bythopirellula polymerisocia]|nr:DNRLRE domain-containing protein [Bythopirellula polymerisocia]
MLNPTIKTSHRFAVSLGYLMVSLLITPATAVDVSISNQVVGKTPGLIGYNSGHFMPGSNTAAWWKYSGVNAARVWATPGDVENGDDNGIEGDGVFSSQSFLERRIALRADPLNPNFINWAHFENGYQSTLSGNNKIQLDYAFSELRGMGVTPLVVIHRTDNADPWASSGTQAGWGDRWEYWQHYYAQAFYLAKNYDIERFQMFNEPTHSSQDISQPDYLERLQFASDAVQSAVADVNSLYGKSLVPQMQGPVSAGGTTLFSANPGGDPRDDTTGWGQLILQNQHTDVLGDVDPNSNLIQTYAYQQYNAAPTTFGNEVNTFQNLLNTTPGGEGLKLALTEFNVHTAGVFDTLPETLDSPSKVARWGSILSNLANSEPDELYVFKFSQTTKGGGGIAKNGVHFVDNDSAPYNIGGSTNGAEIVRLFTKAFAGAQDLLAVPNASGTGASDLSLAAAHNPTKGVYSVFSSNSSTSSRPLNLDLNALGIPTGARIMIEEVSSASHGEVHAVIDLPVSGLISLTQPAESVFLITASVAAPTYSVTLGATDDAMVKSGANSSVNYGASPNLYAKNDATNANARNVSFIKFDAGDIDPEGVDQAILRVLGENAGSASEVITHVYGIADDNWDESTINWNNAPNLADGLGTMDDISQNFIEDIGGSASIVGHLTGTAGEQEILLDVTNFVRDHPDSAITFLIAREVRFDGEDVDDALTSLKLASKERTGDPGPQLMLSLNELALVTDFNGDGTIDGVDLLDWQKGFGMTSGATRADGDADKDGDVDGRDFLLWQRSQGKSINPPTMLRAVPEPASILLTLSLLMASVLRRSH